MQYVNGHELASQCISELLTIHEKVKIPKVYEQDNADVYEKISERHFLGKCQTILKVPIEFAFTQLRHFNYDFLPGCVEHRFIEKYNNDNQVLMTRIRSPALEGHLVEYCSFVSCYSDQARNIYVIGFRGIKHELAQFSEGALVIDLLPSGYVIDVPDGLPENSCRCTIFFQVETQSFVIDGSVFSTDQVTEVAKREYQNIYFKSMAHIERTFHEVHQDPYVILADDTYQSLLDVMSSLGPAHGWTAQIQKYGLSVFTKRNFANDLIVCSRITWVFPKPPSVVRQAFSFEKVVGGYPNITRFSRTRITDTVYTMESIHPSLFVESGQHHTKLLCSTSSIGDRHTISFTSMTKDIPFCLPSGFLFFPIEGGGTRVTVLMQSLFPNGYLPWPEREASRIVATQVMSPFKSIRDLLLKGESELPSAPTPQTLADKDLFQSLILRYSNLFLDSFDKVTETTALSKRFASTDKRKREEEDAATHYVALTSREFSNAPVGSDKPAIKPFLFLMSKNDDAKKRFRRVLHTTSGTMFDSLPTEILRTISSYLDLSDVISLAITCRFFSFFVHNSDKTWYTQYMKRWNPPSSMTCYSDWRESFIIKTTEEKAWRRGAVKTHTWEGHESRLKSILWDKSGLVASCSYDKTVKIWDPETNASLYSMEIPGVVSLHAFSLLDKGLNMLRFLAPKKNGLAEWWEWKDNVATKASETRFGYSLKGVIILANQTITWDDEIVKVWDNQTGNPISVFSDHTGKINSVIALENKYFAVGSADKTISVRTIVGSNSAEAPIVINGHLKSVNCLQSLSSDSFASGSSDMFIKLWDLRNLKDSYQNLLHHSSAVRSFYVNENLLVSGGDDMKLNLYFGRKGPYSHARTLNHSAKIHHVAGYKNNLLIGDNMGIIKKWTFTEVDDS